MKKRERDLDERIADSLRRSFVPPAAPPIAPQRPAAPVLRRAGGAGIPLAPAGPRPSGGGAWPRAGAVLAVAAAVVLVLRWTGEREEPDSPENRPVEELAVAPRPVAPVGPLESVAPEGSIASAPDLRRLYDEAVAGSDGLSMTCGPEDDLGATLAASYGGRVALRPEANQMLSGPFASAEWPTATILRGAGAHPPVLVAESEATHRCCVHFELPSDSGLNLFTWQLGDLVLTEISPFAEPQLLGYFEPELQ